MKAFWSFSLSLAISL